MVAEFGIPSLSVNAPTCPPDETPNMCADSCLTSSSSCRSIAENAVRNPPQLGARSGTSVICDSHSGWPGIYMVA